MGRSKDRLTEKQKRFCDEYLIDLNITRAYKAVYINIKTDAAAGACGSVLLKNPKVRNYIDKRLKEIQTEKTATVQEVMEYLTSVMRGEQVDEVLIGTGYGEQRKTKIQVSNKERLKAAELLAKRFGMLKDNVTVDVQVPVFVGEDELEE